jgi:tRNA(Ile)-lysidine synthase
MSAHCNFHLRGAESDGDEHFAHQYATSLGVEYIKTDFDTTHYASAQGISIEMAARELRYVWFESLRVQYQAQAIAVAHHQDDSVETLLLNLVRGSGIRGMAGIKAKNGSIVRPFLSITRKDILDYATVCNLNYVTDSTNLSDVYTRNFIRLNVLPLLKQINPSAPQSIARTAAHLSDAETIYLHTVQRAQQTVWEGNKISINKLKTFPAPQTILYEMLRPYGFTRFVVESIYNALDGLSGKQFHAPNHLLVKDRDYLLLLPKIESECKEYKIDQSADSCTEPLHLTFAQKPFVSLDQLEKKASVAIFDMDKLSFPLTIRQWKAGDWFIPFGMTGRKKLSDFFVDNKYSLEDKNSCWVLCNGDDIVWIIGKRTDNRCKVDKKTKKMYIISL